MDTALFDEPADLDPPARKKRAANERDGTLELVGRYARQLDDDEQRLLAYAIDTGSPVRIHYVDGDGQPSVRVIEPIEFTGNSVDAWCRLRDDERMFVLSRIGAVSPA
jgi:predicted DNA-binding transcriptional regulator YafY